MGYHIDSEREKDLREAYYGPVVSAAPGILPARREAAQWRAAACHCLAHRPLMDAPRNHARLHGGRALRDPTGWPSGPVLQGLRFGRAGAMGKLWPPGSYGWGAHRNLLQRHKNRRTTTSQLTSSLSTFQAQTTWNRVRCEKGRTSRAFMHAIQVSPYMNTRRTAPDF